MFMHYIGTQKKIHFSLSTSITWVKTFYIALCLQSNKFLIENSRIPELRCIDLTLSTDFIDTIASTAGEDSTHMKFGKFNNVLRILWSTTQEQDYHV